MELNHEQAGMLKKSISYIQTLFDFIVNIRHPERFQNNSKWTVKNAIIFFTHSFSFVGILFMMSDYNELMNAFDSHKLGAMFFLSSLVVTIGIYSVLFVYSIIKKKSGKFSDLFNVFTRVLLTYGALIPLVAILLLIMLEHSFFTLKIWHLFLLFGVIVSYVLIYWYGIVNYLANYFNEKNLLLNRAIAFVGVIFVFFIGSFISFGSLSSEVFNEDIATENILKIYVKRNKLTQEEANQKLACYYLQRNTNND